MKKIIITSICLMISEMAFSQVIIGNDIGTATDKTSVLLEFANTNDRGIVLPYLRTMPAAPTEGTIIVDATDPTKAKIKYYNGTWKDLSSGNEADISSVLTKQPTVTENNTVGTIIGSDQTSATGGALVLESSNKAMILPQVTSTDAVINPAPGMMVYIKGANKRLAVFNGNKWTFWAP
ncbi:hypothetical protein LPB90_14685 [Chryseobacterium sp. LC2016-29]|uniref:hypothetical protein n=1 Tax=Chryseobacterium sp. LC2016-29 TaxID=2897331 RepID=UPI001E492B45|nr:hypothetical protein [Chryseobacterium sp. LC2016-29]MCD0479706.1 hypothetical protein [Chryseobacterium sp. LC2016-29]